jgi:hypothetical protein
MLSAVLWAALITVAVLRVVWVLSYLLAAGPRARTLITSSMYQVDEARRLEVHLRVASATDRLLDNCLLVGAIALAAWTGLFAVARQQPAAELSSTTRALLLLGATVLVMAPIVFRKPDRHFSYIGRSSALFIGLTAVGLSLGSLAHDLVHGTWGVTLAAVVIALLVARDLADTLDEIRRLSQVAAAVSGLQPGTSATPEQRADAPHVTAAASEVAEDPAGRLRNLRDLLDAGLISQAELAAKRAAIVDSI